MAWMDGAEGLLQVSAAMEGDLRPCKRIADQHRTELGFLTLAVFEDAARRGQLLVAHAAPGVLGFVRFNQHRRGTETALYDIAVDRTWQGRGVGRALVVRLALESRRAEREAIVLKCPEELEANRFYERLGFQAMGIDPGRRRMLRLWRLPLTSLTVADACSS
jgi:ribosomal protein S18 acetylase RimI-like enzyme